MILSDDTKDSIRKEFSDWVEAQYAGKSKEERQKFGQFFTPPELTIKMLEKFEDLNGAILDPTAGCGGLLAASVLAEANPRKCFGIELDKDIAALCRDRLAKLGVPRFNIHIGDALKDQSYNFSEQYEDKSLIYLGMKDLGFSSIECNLEIYCKDGKLKVRKWIIDLTKSDKILINQFNQIYKILDIVNNKEKDVYIFAEKLNNRLLLLKKFFKKYLNINFKCDKKRLIEFI